MAHTCCVCMNQQCGKKSCHMYQQNDKQNVDHSRRELGFSDLSSTSGIAGSKCKVIVLIRAFKSWTERVQFSNHKLSNFNALNNNNNNNNNIF